MVEGLAQRIVNGGCRKPQTQARTVLGYGRTGGGAKYRGEFERTLKAVLKTSARPKVPSFSLSTNCTPWWGAGKGDGAMDAGNMLKPALARGELHCVGATTLDEYREFIEKDAALERRFQKCRWMNPLWKIPLPFCAAKSATKCTTRRTNYRQRHRLGGEIVAALYHRSPFA